MEKDWVESKGIRVHGGNFEVDHEMIRVERGHVEQNEQEYKEHGSEQEHKEEEHKEEEPTGQLYRIARQLLWLGARQKYRVFTTRLGLKQEYRGSLLESYFTPFNPQYYIHIIKDGFEFCRVCSKWLWNWRRLSLHFRDGRKMVLISNNSYPYTDTIFQNERLRFLGTSTTMYEHGSREFQLCILDDSELSMLDGMDEYDVPHSPLLTQYNRLPYRIRKFFLGFHYDQQVVEQVDSAELPKNRSLPVAKYQQFIWRNNEVYKNIKPFQEDSVVMLSTRWSEEDHLVLLCMVLALKQQENERYQHMRRPGELLYQKRPIEEGPYLLRR